MKTHLFSKMSQGLLLLSALLATSCKEVAITFLFPTMKLPLWCLSLLQMVKRQKKTARLCLLLMSM